MIYKITVIATAEEEFEFTIKADNEDDAIWIAEDKVEGIISVRHQNWTIDSVDDVIEIDTSSVKGPIYGVEHIEVEWGQRPFGWKLYLDKDTCIEETKKYEKGGTCAGGYLGPIKPLTYYEIPVEGVDEEYLAELLEDGRASTADHWSPKYKDDGHLIGK